MRLPRFRTWFSGKESLEPLFSLCLAYSKQSAYKGKLVYNWSKDTKAGDKTGDNFNNLWHVAKQ